MDFPAISVLKVLWQESPQTLTKIYKNRELSERFSMRELQTLIDLLIDNKLVRTRKIENTETKYFTAINRRHFYDVLSFEDYKTVANDSKWYRKAFTEFKSRGKNLMYSASYQVPKKLFAE